MTLPTTFATLTTATGAELDGNFAALGAITPIPCTIVGTNALTLTPAANTPTISVYNNLQFFVGVIVTTNTGAVTVQVNALSALSVYKDTPSGPVVLTGGELVAKDLAYFFYDSSLNSGAGGFHAVSQAGFPTEPCVGTNRRLVGSTTGGGTTASWTAVELIAEVNIGGQAVKGTNLSLSFNGAGTGVNGMDAGAMPTSAQLAIYAIYNPTTKVWGTLGYAADGAVAASVYPGANAPSGYTYSALIWSGMTDGSSHFFAFNQRDRRIDLTGAQVLNAAAVAANTYYSLSLATFVPPTALTVWAHVAGTSSTADLEVAVAADSSGNYARFIVIGHTAAAVGTFYTSGYTAEIPLLTAVPTPTVWWQSGNTTQTIVIRIPGYTF